MLAGGPQGLAHVSMASTCRCAECVRACVCMCVGPRRSRLVPGEDRRQRLRALALAEVEQQQSVGHATQVGRQQHGQADGEEEEAHREPLDPDHDDVAGLAVCLTRRTAARRHSRYGLAMWAHTVPDRGQERGWGLPPSCP